jgi:hypothetical protein
LQIKQFGIEEQKKKMQLQALKTINKEYWDKQTKWNEEKRQKSELERKEKQDPWTIETHTRATQERRNASDANQAVKVVLDQQC